MTKDPLTIAAKRRVVQQGFLDYYLNRWQNNQYKLDLSLCDECENEIEKTRRWLEALENGADLGMTEDYYTPENSQEIKINQIIEMTLDMAANVTELVES